MAKDAHDIVSDKKNKTINKNAEEVLKALKDSSNAFAKLAESARKLRDA